MDDWRSYNRVAEAYERANGSRLIAPARDLIAMAGPLPPGARVLDVGTGTGVTAQAAVQAGAAIDPDAREGHGRARRLSSRGRAGHRPALP
jgi:ubiquinone/menaquinone biosynthesis C-methylase UbiE